MDLFDVPSRINSGIHTRYNFFPNFAHSLVTQSQRKINEFMEGFFIGVVVGWLLFGSRANTTGRRFDVAAKFNAHVNRKRYERFTTKATARGFEREFNEQWLIHSKSMPFELQSGVESFMAYRQAEEASNRGETRP